MKKTLLAAVAVLVAVGLLAVAGCQRVPLDGTTGADARTRVETSTIALDGATKVDATIRMGVGELTMSGVPSATEAMDAEFTYAPAAWKPDVTYRVSNAVGELYVAQPENRGMSLRPNIRNTWDLKLAGGVPTDLSLKLGVGTSDVNLREIDVRDLEIVTGVGEATIDLSGQRTADVTGRIEAGVGAATIRLPRNVGVRVTGANDGVGDISADGFTVEGKHYVNEAWGKPGPKIEIRLNRGVGDVTLVLVD